MRSFPPDVLIIDRDGIRAARMKTAGKSIRVEAYATARFDAPCFDESPTPMLENENTFSSALSSILRRRSVDGVSVLLPDSWFRTRLLKFDSFPDGSERQAEAVSWAMRKHSPVPPTELRLAWQILDRRPSGTEILVLEARAEALERIERALEAAGLRVVLIEPLSLNVWNALTLGTSSDEEERVLVVASHDDITMLHFRGARPLFVRARRIDPSSADRDVRLAASYMRQNSEITSLRTCWVVGDQLSPSSVEALESALETRSLRPTPEELGIDLSTISVDADRTDLIAALGVFAA